MGACASTAGVGGGAPYIASNDGGEAEYKARYQEGKVIGQGEFGAVKMCTDISTSSNNQELAVKILKKGMTFKDNTLYGALKPQVLQAECDILKTLNGKRYCLELKSIYETPKSIYVITELCTGGEMVEYVSKHPELRTEDVSRIASQLLSAVDHCNKNGIIHRDIKAENCMFVSNSSTAELRLIDFGCGVHDHKTGSNADITQHATFAGSAFFISPEMFQHTYTSATDVWSCGATLYVLVAGYPADDLQKAFNILQKPKRRDLRTLPNMPSNLPNSYYDMLDKLLTYHHKSRPSAGELLQSDEFVQFHKFHQEQSNAPSSSGKRVKKSRTASVHFKGSVERHGLVLNYQRFERAVTTLLATMLSREELDVLLGMLENKDTVHTTKLKVIPVKDLKSILMNMNQQQCVDMIGNLPNAIGYDTFAYHIALLKQFSQSNDTSASKGRRTQRSMSISAVAPQNTMNMETNVHAATASTVSKSNGAVQSTKPRMSQSVAVPRKPARAQSVVVGKTSDLGDMKSELADLKKFKPSMASLRDKPEQPVSRGTTETASLESVEEAREFDC